MFVFVQTIYLNIFMHRLIKWIK